MKSQVQYISFDLDGTLLGSRKHALHLAFIKEFIAEFSGEQSPLSSLITLRAIRRAIESGGEATNFLRAVATYQKLSPSAAADASDYQMRLGRIFPRLQAYFYPLPEACELMRALARRYKIVLSTNPVWPRAIVDLRLKWGGMDSNEFAFITHAENMHFAKPNLRYYQELLRHLNCDADQLIHIGDSLRKDGIASQLGIPVYLLGQKRRARPGIHYTDWPRLAEVLR